MDLTTHTAKQVDEIFKNTTKIVEILDELLIEIKKMNEKPTFEEPIGTIFVSPLPKKTG